jgi:phage portal protein BeeE
VGFIPLVMLQADTDPTKGKVLASAHPMYRAMKNAPNEKMTAMTFRETLTSHAVLQGNGYALILREFPARLHEIAVG